MSFNPSNDKITQLYFSFQHGLKDNRGENGKRHELAFVILNFIISILRLYGHLSISKIHRQMERQTQDLCIVLKQNHITCISRVQLSRILKTFDYESFNDLVRSLWDIELTFDEWIAIDGKELRGTIDKISGEKRGLNVVLAVGHNSKQQQIVGFYSGEKESERTIVKNALSLENNYTNAKITLDALHNSESLLTQLNIDRIKYIVQIKGNQKFLLKDLENLSNTTSPKGVFLSREKGHGRIDIREYQIFKVHPNDINIRWKYAKISHVIKVKRQRENIKTGRQSMETCYYITNYDNNLFELPKAIRKHWTVETCNRVRDVNFGEDSLTILNKDIQKTTASILTFIINRLVQNNENENLNKLREDLVYDNNFVKINQLLAC